MAAPHTPPAGGNHTIAQGSSADADQPDQVTADEFHDLAVPAKPGDLRLLSQLIADAFNPLNVCEWLIPDQDARRDIFPRYFQIYVERAFANGLVHTTPDLAAVALWLPGSGPAEPPDGYQERLTEITGPWVNRFQVFDAELDAHHPIGVEHHHLAILAVAPGRQGQGIGTALLDAHHAALDQLGVTAYLEAASERTRSIYLRHGYVLRPDAPIRLPDGPEMWPMWRIPGIAPQPSAVRRAQSGHGRKAQQVEADAADPRLYVKLAASLRAQIRTGKLAVGVRVPSIQSLLEASRCSRQTCGKALRLLEQEGLLRRVPGLGYHVIRQPAADPGRSEAGGRPER
jgi:GNAT superfamily N-acetyltransferase